MRFFILLFFLITLPFTLRADCTSPAGKQGTIIYDASNMKYCDGSSWNSLTISTSGNACSPIGMIKKNTNDIQFCGPTNFWVNMDSGTGDGACSTIGLITFRNSKLEWCDTTNTWKVLGTPPDPCTTGVGAIGSTCSGGALFAGNFGDRYLMITPSGCTDSANPSCLGGADTVTRIWRGSTGSNADIAGITNTGAAASSPSTETGDIITPLITADGSTSSDSGADFCADMTYGGYSDWYLPSKSELAYIYCHSSASAHNTLYPNESPDCFGYKGKTSELTGFHQSLSYMSSTEGNTNNQINVSFDSGFQGNTLKSSMNSRIRCARKFTPATDPCTLSNTVGTTCNSGAVKAGTFSGWDYYTTPGGCNDSSTPTCNGIDSLTKNFGADVLYGMQDRKNGNINTTSLVAADATATAALYCENMIYGGYSDWYLPAVDELAYLYTQASALGGFKAAKYMSSTENAFSTYKAINLSTGSETNESKSTVALRIRCIRREAATDPCAGTPPSGIQCSGGALYLGQFDGGKYMVTPGNCTDSSTPTCNGAQDTVSKTWRGSSGSSVNITGISDIGNVSTPSSQRGNITTPLITADPSTSSDSAADFCNDMVYGGYNDWYLPSKSELAYLYCHTKAGGADVNYPQEDPNCVNYGGKTHDIMGATTNYYWSSTEYDGPGLAAHGGSLYSGQQVTSSKGGNYYVRCVRRY